MSHNPFAGQIVAYNIDIDTGLKKTLEKFGF
jgi:hypothetical protein